MIGTSLVGWIGQNILELLPIAVVKSYQLGVREVNGRATTTLQPGIYFRVPFFYTVHVLDSVEQGLNLPTQSVTTSDGRKVSVSANISYEIEDAMAVYSSVQDLDETLSFTVMRHIAAKIRRTPLLDVLDDQTGIEASIKRSVQTKVDGWGVRILAVGLTDLVEARQYRLFADPQ